MVERRAERIRIATTAEVSFHVDGETHRLQLHNVSVQGCMTDSPSGLLLKGRRVIVELLDDIKLPARVVWQRGSFVGLRFLAPLASALIWYFSSRADAADSRHFMPRDRFGRPLGALPVFPNVLETLWQRAPCDSPTSSALDPGAAL